MNAGWMRIAILAAAIVGATLLAGPTARVGAAGACSATPTRTLSGPQDVAFTSTLAANEHVDANTASWTGILSYPVHFDSTADSCWDSGVIKGLFPVSTTWSTYHGTTGFGVRGPGFTINHPRVFNYGDGIGLDNADGFLISDAYLSYIHDDCVQNDELGNGTLTNSFLDGCYVGLSARPTDGTSFDGHLNTWRISNSLIRLQAMPTLYKGTAAGHGGFFKWDTTGKGPMLNISNTIFRADQVPNHQDLNLPAGYNVTCSNNTMVWLGPGSFPGSLPSCFTVTTDRAVWDNAAHAWADGHPGVITGPKVSVGDASIVEGDSGAKSLRFPLSLSSPPGAGSVTVYWSTAPGTADSSDFTTTKGKVVFTGSQVLKMLTVPVKPDTTAESTELMYVVAAGVDGGQNYRERGVGTILDDDPGSGIRLSVSDARVVEGDSGTRALQVPITLSSAAAADVIINWSTQATGSASPGSDYTTRSGTTKIPLGARTVTVTIPILSDTAPEGMESFNVVVSGATNADMFKPTGTVTIQDDD